MKPKIIITVRSGPMFACVYEINGSKIINVIVSAPALDGNDPGANHDHQYPNEPTAQRIPQFLFANETLQVPASSLEPM